jgi:predicted  nucleic acid-binding Zn-ribbon protein
VASENYTVADLLTEVQRLEAEVSMLREENERTKADLRAERDKVARLVDEGHRETHRDSDQRDHRRGVRSG